MFLDYQEAHDPKSIFLGKLIFLLDKNDFTPKELGKNTALEVLKNSITKIFEKKQYNEIFDFNGLFFKFAIIFFNFYESYENIEKGEFYKHLKLLRNIVAHPFSLKLYPNRIELLKSNTYFKIIDPSTVCNCEIIGTGKYFPPNCSGSKNGYAKIEFYCNGVVNKKQGEKHRFDIWINLFALTDIFIYKIFEQVFKEGKITMARGIWKNGEIVLLTHYLDFEEFYLSLDYPLVEKLQRSEEILLNEKVEF